MSKDARRKSRKAGQKAGFRREAGRTPARVVRVRREAGAEVDRPEDTKRR